MYIDWNKLSKNNKLDYFAVTILNDKILKTQAYYLVNEKINFIGDPIWDYLLCNNYLKCFSYGVSESNCEKFDFLIMSENKKAIYSKLIEQFSFLDCSVIAKFKNILGLYSLNFDNHIIGLKRNVNSSQNICLYFRTGKYFHYSIARPLIHDLISGFSLDKSFPEIGVGTHLHMIALDFSEQQFKLKFYFKFNGDYDFKNLESAMCNSKIVSELINTNCHLDIFQVAKSKFNFISYNFYFRKT